MKLCLRCRRTCLLRSRITLLQNRARDEMSRFCDQVDSLARTITPTPGSVLTYFTWTPPHEKETPAEYSVLRMVNTVCRTP